MALRYEISKTLKPLLDGQEPEDGAILVEVLCRSEFRELGDFVDRNARKTIDALYREEACFASEYPGYVVGSLAIPDKDDPMGKRGLLAFYWRKGLLIFVEDTTIAADTLKQICEEGLEVDADATCLQLMLESFLVDDIGWMTTLEDDIEAAEETMVESKRNVPEKELTGYRRLTVRMAAYYEQFASMTSTLYSNENGMLDEEERQGFKPVMEMADRLLDRAEGVRDHSLALRDLHQTQIGVKQNDTMRLLTVVTIIIVPTELITAWFGMDFPNLPGVNDPWGLPLAVGIIVVFTLALFLFFRHKKWI